MSTKPERDWSRAHAAEHVVAGGALLGAAAVGNYANDKALERRGLQKPFKTVMQRKKLKPAHARFVGVKAATRAGQIVGLPMAAYGAYNAIRPDHKVPRVSVKRDVVKPVGRALAMADAKDHYRRVIKRDLSQADSKKLLRRKRLGRDLSLVGGTLGGLALTLRSPEIARAVASRSKRLASTKPVQRLAALEPKATKTSNTLGIAAIGSGSAGSFNYASQQRLEAKQIKKSYVGGGKWVAANALSRRARASLKAQAKAKKLHGAAGGATDKDTKLAGLLHAEWNRQRGVIRELEGRGHIRSLKGNIREGRALLPEGVGGYQAPVPVKGPQRKATRLVVMDPTKMDGNERIAVHEMTHATAGRKPLSQQVRFARHPEKAAGEEARAVASEGLRGRSLRRHGYNQMAAGRTSPRISGQTFGANWKSGYRRVGTKLGSYPAKDPVVRVRRATGVNLDDSTHIGALISAGAVTSYGGAVAGREYQHRQRSKRVAKGLPRWAINGSVGRVRVAGQHSKDMFYVIDNKDTRRLEAKQIKKALLPRKFIHGNLFGAWLGPAREPMSPEALQATQKMKARFKSSMKRGSGLAPVARRNARRPDVVAAVNERWAKDAKYARDSREFKDLMAQRSYRDASRVEKGLQPYAILGKIGRVRVTGMHAKDMFTVVDGKDTKRLVHRSRLQFIKTPGKRKPQGPTQLPLPFEKRDDRFLREHRDRISPDAERGYNSMRRQRNKDRAWAAVQGGLTATNAAGLVQAVKHRSKVWIPVTAAAAGVSAVQAVRHGRKATAYDRGPMEGIRRKARERARAGLYGPGRGMEPVDASSRRVGKAGGQGGYSHSEAKRQWKASGAVPRAAGAASSQPRAAKPAKPLKYALRDAVMGKPSAQERRRRWMESGSPREGSVRTAKRPRRGPSWVDPAQYRIPRHMKLRAAGSAGVALAGVGGIAAYERLRKDRKAETVAGGVAGVAAADAASVYGGQKAKYALKRRRDAKLTQMRRTDRAAYNTAMRDWRAHLDRHGVDRVSEKMSASQRAKVMGRYPKSMPGWRGQRALAFKNKPVVSGAIYAAGALAGAAAGRQVGKALVPRLPVPRSLPKGLVRRPTLRRSYVARRPSGLQVSVRGGFG